VSRKKVVVVGAGALGLSCADQLSRDPGLNVVVVDKDFPASGSSGLSAGVFTRQYMDREAVAIRTRAVRQMEELQKERGLDLRKIGFLRLARDEEAIRSYEGSVELQKEFGLDDSRVLEAEEVRRIIPEVDLSGVIGALYSPHDGYLDGAQLCNLLVERIEERGGRLKVKHEVLGLKRGGTARYALETSRGDVPADLIVNATGAWGQKVGERLETPVSVVNERHQAFTFQLPEGVETVFPMTLDYVPGSGGSGLFFRQEGEHQLLAGMHSNEILGHPVKDPDEYFRGVDAEGSDQIVEALAKAFPDVEGIGYQGGWSGLYPHSGEDRLVLGPHPGNPDVIVGAGLGGIGLSMAMTLGEILAGWVREGRPGAFEWADRYLPPRT